MSEAETRSCDNCKLKIAAQNYMVHTLHCVRHLELCNKCGEPVPKDKLDEHIETEHAKESCAMCGENMDKGLLQKHAQSDCMKRLISCHYCGLELPCIEMSGHAGYCGTRTEKCEECGEFVMLKYTNLHLDSNHKFLKLKDEPGPTASWEENRPTVSSARATNTENSGEATLLPCEFCDGMFTPRELRRHQVSCTLGWDTTVPVLRRISVERCETCGKSIASKEYEAHRVLCIEENLANSSVVPCDECDTTVPFDEYNSHYSLCAKYQPDAAPSGRESASRPRKNSVIPCDLCNRPIPFNDYQKHRIFCVEPTLNASSSSRRFCADDTDLKLPCEFCERSFSPDELAAHQICCSPISQQTNIPCELCGELKSLSEVLEHQLTCRVAGDY